MAVTSQQIAEDCGVSRPTVSRVLNGSSVYSDETRSRVFKAAQRLGYRVNTAARSTASGRFDAVALLLSESYADSLLPGQLLRGIQAGLKDLNKHLMVETLGDDALTDPARVPKLLRELCSDGLLVNYNAHIPAKMVELIKQYGLPAVWINSQHDTDCIYPDDRLAGAELTRQVIEAGHCNIAYIDFITPATAEAHYSGIDRHTGYADVMTRAGLQPRRFGNQKLLYSGQAVQALHELLASDDRPTAVVCYSDDDARRVMLAAAANGLQVPRDLSVVCLAGDQVLDAGLYLTSMLLPHFAIGQGAVEMLAEKCRKPAGALPPRCVPFVKQAGQTLARCS